MRISGGRERSLLGCGGDGVKGGEAVGDRDWDEEASEVAIGSFLGDRIYTLYLNIWRCWFSSRDSWDERMRTDVNVMRRLS